MVELRFRDDELWWIPTRLEQSGIPRASHLHSSARSRDESHSAVPMSREENAAGSKAAMPHDTSPSVNSAVSADASASSKATGIVFGRGLGFAGQVFGLYSTTRSCLVGVEEKKFLKGFLSFKVSFLRRFFPNLDNSRGPSFHFYIDEEDAKAYLKRLKIRDMEIGSVPLHLAHKFFKERPSLFRFIPAKKQVDLAKRVIKETRGKDAAAQFQGVPIFTSRNLSILVVGPESVRWFRPYFFKKQELDGVIRSSMEQHYQSLIINRRAQRHSQLGDLPSDMGDEDLDMLEAQDMQEIMEENADEWGPMLESIMAKAAQIYVQDALDNALFGNKWCRKILGIQPRFPISVDTFERRAVLEPSAESGGSSYSEKANESIAASTNTNWLYDKLGLGYWLDKRAELEAPHLTVVAGIAGSTPEQVMKVATSAIQQAKDRIESNKMPLESLFIADLGSPQLWSTI